MQKIMASGVTLSDRAEQNKIDLECTTVKVKKESVYGNDPKKDPFKEAMRPKKFFRTEMEFELKGVFKEKKRRSNVQM